MEKIILNENQDAVGWLWFIPDSDFVKGVPCTGWGKERYLEGSVYEGQVEYDGVNFYRQGYGVQDFSNSTYQVTCPDNTKLDKYVGFYNRHVCSWMYGNGVAYLVDKDTNQPKKFVKGFFHYSRKQDEWHGDFDYNSLYAGYTKDMECDNIIPYAEKRANYVARYKDKTTCDYLFMGDSWVEIWQLVELYDGSFVRDTAGLDAINVGIGGTKYFDWEDLLDELVICHNPKKVFINLGFNDLHSGNSVKDTFNSFVKNVTKLTKCIDGVKIYVTSVTHTSPYSHLFDKEVELNNLIKNYCAKSKNLVYVQTNKLFMQDGKMIKNMDDFCIKDKIHLNRKGYDIWAPFVIDFIKNN